MKVFFSMLILLAAGHTHAKDCQISFVGGGCLKGTCTDVYKVNGKKWAYDKDPSDRNANTRIQQKLKAACDAGASDADFRSRGFRTPSAGEY